MATSSEDPVHFMHTDLDGDKLEVIEGEQGAVFWTYPRDDDFYSPRDPVAVAVHSGHDLQLLIDTLTTIQNNR
jgi:hypothetical protein